MRVRSLVLLLLAACGGDDVSEVTPDAAPDAPIVDAQDANAIHGRFVGLLVQDQIANIPMADAYVRIEDANGEFQEAMTEADGTVAFTIAPGSGPYDWSFAKRNFQSISVLGVDGDVGDVQTGPATGSDASVAITGSITNKISANDRVVIGSAGVPFVVSTRAANYTAMGFAIPIPQPLVGLEVDANGDAVNIVATAPSMFDAAATLPLAFPATPPAVATKTATVMLPATGVFTGAALTEPLAMTAFSTVLVAREQTPDEGAAVGTGTIAAPVANAAALTYRSFSGDVAPTHVRWGLRAPAPSTLAIVGTFLNPADGATLTIPTIDALAVSGATLDAVRYDATATGYPWVEVLVNGDRPWYIYAHGGALTGRPLPHLPSQATFAITNPARPSATVSVSVLSDETQPWRAYRNYERTFATISTSTMTTGR